MTFLKNECRLPKLVETSKDGVKTYRKVDENANNWDGWNNAQGGDYDYINVGVVTDIQLEIKIPRNVELTIKSHKGDVDIENFDGKIYAESFLHKFFHRSFQYQHLLYETLLSTRRFEVF